LAAVLIGCCGGNNAHQRPPQPSQQVVMPPFATLCTRESREELADGVVRLSVWYARKRALEPAKPVVGDFAELLTTRTALRTHIHMSPAGGSEPWVVTCARLQQLFEQRLHDNDGGAALEEEAVGIVWPAVQRRVAALGPVVFAPDRKTVAATSIHIS
jgi:hypothetical protein